MATIEYWIQLENKPWDTAPRNIDRLSGQTIQDATGQAPVPGKIITSPMTGASRTVTMNLPVNGDALILRRYRPPQLQDKSDAWTVPDDRKVNPWDLNEPNPTDSGTMGTIPGATIEANVGDNVIVHFRNHDTRTDSQGMLLSMHERAHSLHTHGFVFENRYDGAYPLSPSDASQPVGAEGPLWALVGVTGGINVGKKGDRVPGPNPSVPGVPHGGTFDYHWETFGWQTTAGVWHYHDHSVCDMDNINLGAIGFVVIHNPADPDDVVGDPSVARPGQLVQGLPGGSFNGSPVRRNFFPISSPIPVLPADLDPFLEAHPPHEAGHLEEFGEEHHDMDPDAGEEKSAEHGEEPHIEPFRIVRGDLMLELDPELKFITKFGRRVYRRPPENALYLQLYHELPGTEMLINGRKFLGNAPTLVAGQNTKMRFGVVGMNMAMFHTFHLHGHRWVLPGPRGDNPGGGNGPNAIQNSPLVGPASQFEDTKIFGPANSFGFTINQGTFMGAPIGLALGEWYMHCHVLMHMESKLGGGMLGSLLVVQAGAQAAGLPSGEPCGGHMVPPEPQLNATVQGGTNACKWIDVDSLTSETTIKVGGTVKWEEIAGCGSHTVISVGTPSFTNVMTLPDSRIFTVVGDYKYICGIHGGDAVAKTGMWGIIHVVP